MIEQVGNTSRLHTHCRVCTHKLQRVCVCCVEHENCLSPSPPAKQTATRCGVSGKIHTAERGGSRGPTHYTTTVTPLHYTHTHRVCVYSGGTIEVVCA